MIRICPPGVGKPSSSCLGSVPLGSLFRWTGTGRRGRRRRRARSRGAASGVGRRDAAVLQGEEEMQDRAIVDERAGDARGASMATNKEGADGCGNEEKAGATQKQGATKERSAGRGRRTRERQRAVTGCCSQAFCADRCVLSNRIGRRVGHFLFSLSACRSASSFEPSFGFLDVVPFAHMLLGSLFCIYFGIIFIAGGHSTFPHLADTRLPRALIGRPAWLW